ncbi:MAG: DUF1905 domain-containing protein [Actinomycetota bacterium]|nr:DUF1905 domain-containing protein [Actinomycetota bacterium]
MSAYEFTAPLWKWQGDGTASWRFVTLPFDVTDEIDDITTGRQGGFGSVPVKVTVGRTTWTTSVFPSKEQKSFILPVKAPVRKAEGLSDGNAVAVHLELVGFD